MFTFLTKLPAFALLGLLAGCAAAVPAPQAQSCSYYSGGAFISAPCGGEASK